MERLQSTVLMGILATAIGSATLASSPPPAANPFLSPSSLPYGMPDFGAIHDSDFGPAFDVGMAEQDREIAAITANPAAPSFENTIVALERSGQILDRTQKVVNNFTEAFSDPGLDAMQEQYVPKLAAHQDAMHFNQKLFGRIRQLYQQRASLGLDPESLQLLERYYKTFVYAGAALSAEKRQQLRHLDEQIATAGTRNEQMTLKSNNDAAVIVDNVAELDGLSAEDISSAASAAKARGLDGRWLIALEHPTVQSVWDTLKNRRLRERIYRAAIARGNGGADDTTAIVSKLVHLRALRAELLGYSSHAAYQLADQEAGTPAAVSAMLAQVSPGALAAVAHDAADIQALIDAQAAATGTASFKAQPWDWQFYSQQVRAARFGFTDEQVRPYFELDRVMKDGLFYAAHELYGITFTERTDLPVYDPSVRVFEVRNADGTPLALFLADYFARDNKQGGAWEDVYVTQSRLLGFHAVVVNCLNLPRPEPGQPVLMTFGEVTGMFHEMGHALHEMFSTANYPLLAGTNVPRDFVEFPSQFNEMWARDPKVLAHIARHFRTGEPIPKPLLDQVLAAQTFNAGYGAVSYLEAAMLDMSWYTLSAAQVPPANGVMDFEARALARDGLAAAGIPVRYHTPYFSHIFATSDDYSAGYYGYLWSEELARDAGQWFTDHGGLTRANGDAFRLAILSRGRTEEPEILWQKFYGKAPEIGPLLDYKGFPRS